MEENLTKKIGKCVPDGRLSKRSRYQHYKKQIFYYVLYCSLAEGTLTVEEEFKRV